MHTCRFWSKLAPSSAWRACALSNLHRQTWWWFTCSTHEGKLLYALIAVKESINWDGYIARRVFVADWVRRRNGHLSRRPQACMRTCVPKCLLAQSYHVAISNHIHMYIHSIVLIYVRQFSTPQLPNIKDHSCMINGEQNINWIRSINLFGSAPRISSCALYFITVIGASRPSSPCPRNRDRHIIIIIIIVAERKIYDRFFPEKCVCGWTTPDVVTVLNFAPAYALEWV